MRNTIQKNSRRMEWCKWGGLALICITAFLYSLFYVETAGKYSTSYSPDEGNYINMAKRLLSEGVYSFWGNGPDAYVSPGFPLFLALFMKIFGTDLQGIFCIKVIQCLLSALTVFFTFMLGYLLTKKYSVGIIASTLIAINGVYAFYSCRLLTETLYYFTMMLFFVVFVLAVQRDKLWLHLLSGALLCVSVMVRPLIIIVLPFIYIPLIIRKWKQWKEMCQPILLFAAGFIIVGLPWWIRNLVTMDRLILLATQTNPIYAGLAQNVAALGLTDPGSLLGNVVLLFKLLLKDPLGTLYWMTLGKFNIIFMANSDVGYGVIFTSVVKNITLYIGLAGCVRAFFTREYRWPTIVFLIYLLSSFLFVPTQRYALQYLPFLAIFTGYILTICFQSKPCKENAPAPTETTSTEMAQVD